MNTVLRLVEMFFWILTAIGAVLAALIVIGGVLAAKGAPQEAAAAAIGLSVVIIPYCLARAVSELVKPKD